MTPRPFPDPLVETPSAVVAAAYAAAADGDLMRALIWGLEDLLACEARVAVAEAAVSRGFIRAAAHCGPGGGGPAAQPTLKALSVRSPS